MQVPPLVCPRAEVSVLVRGRALCSAAGGIRAAVFADMGLAIASDGIFAPELADGRVLRLLESWALPDIDLWAVFPTGRLATATTRVRRIRRAADAKRRLIQEAAPPGS